MKDVQCHSRMVILIALFLLMAPASSGQDQAKEDEFVKKGLRLSVELVGNNFLKQREAITVKLKLENTSKSPVYIYKRLGFGPAGFRVTILDANNNWVSPTFIRESFPDPVESKDDLRAIEPGKSIEQQIQIPLDFYDIAPGDHTLKIGYVSPVAVDAVPSGLTALTSDDGKLEAKPIRFKVLAP
jgi:hypothetical protein